MLRRIGCHPRAPRGGVPQRVGPLVSRWRVPCPPSATFSGGRRGTLLLSGASARHWTVSYRTWFLYMGVRRFPKGDRKALWPRPQTRNLLPPQASVAARLSRAVTPAKGAPRNLLSRRVSKGLKALRGSAEGRALCSGETRGGESPSGHSLKSWRETETMRETPCSSMATP